MKQQDDWHLTGDIDHEMGRGDPFAAAIRGTRMSMIITDPRQPDNPIVFANAAFQRLSGYDREEIIGRNCRFLQGPLTDPRAVAEIREAVAAERDLQIDILNYRKDGETFWNALYLSPVRNKDGGVEFFFASQLDVSDRIEAHETVAREKSYIEREVAARTKDLEAALAVKTVLLHEVDHRVKNNLTMIGSLLRLQARSIPDPALRATLDSMLERVDALATVHRRLYQSEDITRFDVGALTETLVADVIGATGRTNIDVVKDIDPIEVPSAHASAIGLVINELLTNAVKHAYADGRSGRLQVSAKSRAGRAEIVIQDDGPGFPLEDRSGLGRKLIGRLSKQAAAETRWLPADPGTRAVLAFEVED